MILETVIKDFNLLFVIFTDGSATDYLGWSNIGYLISYIEKYDPSIHIDVKFFMKDTSFDSIAEIVVETCPDLIGLPVLQENFNISLDFCEYIKKILSESRIVLGNIEATVNSQYILSNYDSVDFIVIGEGEETLLDLCKHLKLKRSLDTCKGIIWKKNGVVINNPLRPLLNNLDEYPFPTRNFHESKRTSYSIIGSRGCLAKCTFCDSNVIYSDYTAEGSNIVRIRSMANVLDEMEELVKKRGCLYIIFYDSTFCRSEEDIEERLSLLYEGMCKRDLYVQMFINLRVEQISDDVMLIINKLITRGLDTLFLGIETGSQDDLTLYGKRTRINDNYNAIKLLKKYGIIGPRPPIIFEFGFICFNPYSTLEKLKQNISFIRDNELYMDFSLLKNKLRISGGASIVKKIKGEGLLLQDHDLPIIDPLCYRFADVKIQRVLDILEHCDTIFNMKYFRKLTTLYNRYCLVYDNKDKVFSNITHMYDEYIDYKTYISKVTIDVFEKIVNLVENEVMDYKPIVDYEYHKHREYIKLSNANIEILRRKLAILLFKKNSLMYDSLSESIAFEK